MVWHCAYCNTEYTDQEENPCIVCIENYIRTGSDVNERDADGNTPLHMAKNKVIIDLLIAAGADVNAVNHKGQRPDFSGLKYNEKTSQLELTKADGTLLLLDYKKKSGGSYNFSESFDGPVYCYGGQDGGKNLT